jgi:hypothetical protein
MSQVGDKRLIVSCERRAGREWGRLGQWAIKASIENLRAWPFQGTEVAEICTYTIENPSDNPRHAVL